MRRLNIGCGRDILPKEGGWVNADIRELDGIDIVLDAAEEFPFYPGLPRAGLFPDLVEEAFSQILANDLIEHLPFEKVPFFLSECFRVLKPGGILNLRLPDLAKIFRRAVGGSLPWEEAVRLTYGDQSADAGGEYGAHRHGYDATTIAELLSEAGFVDIDVNGHPTEYNYYCTARRPE